MSENSERLVRIIKSKTNGGELCKMYVLDVCIDGQRAIIIDKLVLRKEVKKEYSFEPVYIRYIKGVPHLLLRQIIALKVETLTLLADDFLNTSK